MLCDCNIILLLGLSISLQQKQRSERVVYLVHEHLIKGEQNQMNA